jgi:hypothetical protein
MTLVALALMVLLLGLRAADAQCSGSTYSYGSGACASCAAGAAFVSAADGCTPSAALTAGPTDTAFYLSGSQAEGAAAFTLTGAEPTFVADHAGVAGGALALVNGTHLDAAGASAPAALPSGGSAAFSASAWVKCAAPATYAAVTYAAVLEWGAAGDAQMLASPQALALVVGGASNGIVTTLAGSGYKDAGTGSGAFADGTGAAARFWWPADVAAIPSSGVIAVAETNNNRIRLVTPLGDVTTLAGNSIFAFADGTGTAASFNEPFGVAVIPSSGVIVVADRVNDRIRLVTPLGVVTTLAGSDRGFADGTGAAARFSYPSGVAVIPSSGVIVVADSFNHRIRLVTPLGVVSTLAGSTIGEGTPNGAFADGTGTAASFSFPIRVAVIPSSSVIVVADSYNHRIRLVTPLGVVTTLAGSGRSSFADGTGAAAFFRGPSGVSVIPSSSIIVVTDVHRIRLVTPLGVVTTLAGIDVGAFADGKGSGALFSFPSGVAVLPSSGVIAVADSENYRIRLIALPPVLPACDSTWHHVALTYSPSASPYQLSAFLDGSLFLASAATITLPTRASSTLRIGWSGDSMTNGGSLFAGNVSDIRIYARALTAAEVAALSQPPPLSSRTPTSSPTASISASPSSPSSSPSPTPSFTPNGFVLATEILVDLFLPGGNVSQMREIPATGRLLRSALARMLGIGGDAVTLRNAVNLPFGDGSLSPNLTDALNSPLGSRRARLLALSTAQGILASLAISLTSPSVEASHGGAGSSIDSRASSVASNVSQSFVGAAVKPVAIFADFSSAWASATGQPTVSVTLVRVTTAAPAAAAAAEAPALSSGAVAGIAICTAAILVIAVFVIGKLRQRSAAAPVISKEASSTAPPGPSDVFLSYAWGGEEPPGSGVRPLQRRAHKVAAAIKAHTHGTVWLDTECMGAQAQGGGGLASAMSAGIDACGTFVCCMSAAYAASANCKAEFIYALNKRKRILFVNVGEPAWAPYSLSGDGAWLLLRLEDKLCVRDREERDMRAHMRAQARAHTHTHQHARARTSLHAHVHADPPFFAQPPLLSLAAGATAARTRPLQAVTASLSCSGSSRPPRKRPRPSATTAPATQARTQPRRPDRQSCRP